MTPNSLLDLIDVEISKVKRHEPWRIIIIWIKVHVSSFLHGIRGELESKKDIQKEVNGIYLSQNQSKAIVAHILSECNLSMADLPLSGFWLKSTDNSIRYITCSEHRYRIYDEIVRTAVSYTAHAPTISMHDLQFFRERLNQTASEIIFRRM